MAVKTTERFVKWHYERWCFSHRVQRMSALERGVYHSALMIQVQYGSVPAEPAMAARIMHLKESDVKRAWPMVMTHFKLYRDRSSGENVLVNEVMADVFDFQRDYEVDDLCAIDAQNENGQCANSAHDENAQCAKSAQAQNGECATDAHAQMRNSPSRTRARTLFLSNSTSNSGLVSDTECANAQNENTQSAQKPNAQNNDDAGKDKNSRLLKVQAAALFEEFWKEYPVKKDKRRALDTWLRIKPDADLMRRIMESLALQAKTDQWRRGIIPHPSTWLRNARWEDETDAQNQNPHAQTENSQQEVSTQSPEDLPEMDALPPQLWPEVMRNLTQNELSEDEMTEWIKPLRPLGVANDEVWIAAQSQIARNWVASNYRTKLEKYFERTVRIIILPESDRE